jgi:hypothetical protein
MSRTGSCRGVAGKCTQEASWISPVRQVDVPVLISGRQVAVLAGSDSPPLTSRMKVSHSGWGEVQLAAVRSAASTLPAACPRGFVRSGACVGGSDDLDAALLAYGIRLPRTPRPTAAGVSRLCIPAAAGYGKLFRLTPFARLAARVTIDVSYFSYAHGGLPVAGRPGSRVFPALGQGHAVAETSLGNERPWTGSPWSG